MIEDLIIYEDYDLIVLNKPSGLIVNDSITAHDQPTLQKYLYHYLGLDRHNSVNSSDIEDDSFFTRCGIVHRLDKETSGVLLVAKNEESFKKLQKQFKDRIVEKQYTALVIGEIKDNTIEINASIKRHPKYRTKFAVVEGGKESFTTVKKIRSFMINNELLTLVDVFPKTGRTHQIRVHLCAIGHPIVGDNLYSTRNQMLKWRDLFERLMLHAKYIKFIHPSKNVPIEFTAPLPKDFSGTML